MIVQAEEIALFEIWRSELGRGIHLSIVGLKRPFSLVHFVFPIPYPVTNPRRIFSFKGGRFHARTRS